MDISLNHDILASFTLHKWPILSKSGANVADTTELGYKGAPKCPWDSIPVAQTPCVYQLWMYEVVWGGYQPHPWCYGIIFTPQVTLNTQIWGQLGQCSCIKVPPYAFETAYQWLKHCVYVYYECMKRSEVEISLNHDTMTSILLHKWPWIPESEANVASVAIEGCNYMPLRQHTSGSNMVWMSTINVWRGLKWISASTMTLWHHFHFITSDPDFPKLVSTWSVVWCKPGWPKKT